MMTFTLKMFCPRACVTASLLVLMGCGDGAAQVTPPATTQVTTAPASAIDPPATPPLAPASTPAPPVAATKIDRATFGPLTAVFEQPTGSFRVLLATTEAPRLCANFVNLVQRRYYEGMQWNEFSAVVRQIGDSDVGREPTYTLPREFSPKLFFDVGGNLCASNTTEDSSARARPTRIFITVKPQDRWNLVYSVFGRVTEGLSVAQGLQELSQLTSIRIEGNTAPLLNAYATDLARWDQALDKVKPARAPLP